MSRMCWLRRCVPFFFLWVARCRWFWTSTSSEDVMLARGYFRKPCARLIWDIAAMLSVGQLQLDLLDERTNPPFAKYALLHFSFRFTTNCLSPFLPPERFRRIGLTTFLAYSANLSHPSRKLEVPSDSEAPSTDFESKPHLFKSQPS